MAKNSKNPNEQEVPFWLLDGFVGILSLMIYNFLLYLFSHAGGIMLELHESMGYFGLNSFTDFGFTIGQMSIGIIAFFLISFFLGVGIGNFLRKKGKK
ncbi:MAG TPA: hypothetical protein VJH92_04095 [Candidatus Nanoarchaeia archaeon]|nr:hypothetical protein [Candidatus Nanoarchaeia archaeon]